MIITETMEENKVDKTDMMPHEDANFMLIKHRVEEFTDILEYFYQKEGHIIFIDFH